MTYVTPPTFYLKTIFWCKKNNLKSPDPLNTCLHQEYRKNKKMQKVFRPNMSFLLFLGNSRQVSSNHMKNLVNYSLRFFPLIMFDWNCKWVCRSVLQRIQEETVPKVRPFACQRLAPVILIKPKKTSTSAWQDFWPPFLGLKKGTTA